MAARCAVCGKGPRTGYTVSHSHIRNKRRFLPNLQPVRTTVDGQNVRLRVCAKCLKAGKVQRVSAN
ncbi:50S ribosomal protein L28 [Bifidobacterium criceti]|uniref:Large ribosomal subunit protein bL28 n=1 Tax=Bifidobacterium criceti TaxID=1960969 RepID=A0A2A2EFQ2_9BIFI|nr:50S ribosomal protein L28 [Bifidobacterium criceti]PAU68064.1 50S ribosomal protein L28 [Bifidobacterium criceti]